MDKKPFFTIGVPVYNTEKYVAKCLDSILDQDFADFEIICVNDGSTDSSLQVLNDCRNKDKRIRVISRENGGLTAVRNTVLMYSQGQYICMVDSDDYMAENALSNAYKYIQENNHPDVMHVGFGYYSLKAGEKNVQYYYPEYPGDEYFSQDISKDERAVKLLVDNKYMPSICAKYLKKQFMAENGIVFDLRYSYGEDSAFSIMLNRKANTIAYAPFVQFYYQHDREGSITTNISMKAYHTYLCYKFEFYSDSRFYNISNESREGIERRRKNSVFEATQYLISLIITGQDKDYILEYSDMVNRFICNDLKKDVVPDNKKNLKNKIIYNSFRFLGLKRTIKLLYAVAHIKK